MAYKMITAQEIESVPLGTLLKRYPFLDSYFQDNTLKTAGREAAPLTALLDASVMEETGPGRQQTAHADSCLHKSDDRFLGRGFRGLLGHHPPGPGQIRQPRKDFPHWKYEPVK